MSYREDAFSRDLTDKFGRKFQVGDKVVRPIKNGQTVSLEICEVTKLTETQLFLDNSSQAIIYPKRLLIITSILEECVN